MYFRLLRLLSVSVQPLFVFDGRNKPPMKRNKRTAQGGSSIPDYMTKELLKLFGFASHTAPGEAEAECALLQREGIVDAVLSEDVDTLMFGSGLTFRSWTPENKRSKTPTHVTVYEAKATKEGPSGLDREGMILVAMMSGGDYKTEGIPGCGVKVACEAARAGYGKSLCQISRTDKDGITAWRENLAHELHTNQSKLFKTKHKALKVPEDFPDREVLGYYTHPVVSSIAGVKKLRDKLSWDEEINIPGLRKFVEGAFEWTGKIGATRFIRGLAPVLLVHKLRMRGDRRDSGIGDVVLTAMNEMELVRSICGNRVGHFDVDGIPEMRVVYHPTDIVDIVLDEEEDNEQGDFGRDGLAPPMEDDQIEAYLSDEEATPTQPGSPSKRKPSTWDSSQPDKIWIPTMIVKLGVPLKAEDYEESLRDPVKFIRQKAAAKRAATKKAKAGTAKGALDKFVTVSKKGKETGKDIDAEAQLKSQHSNTSAQGFPLREQSSSDSNINSRQTRAAARATTSSKTSATTAIKNTATVTTARVIKKSRAKGKAVESPLRQNPWAASQASPKANLQISKPTTTRSVSQEKGFEVYNLELSPSPESFLPSSPPPPVSNKKDGMPAANGCPNTIDFSPALSMTPSSSSSYRKRSRSTFAETLPSVSKDVAPGFDSSFSSFTGNISASEPEPEPSRLPPINRRLDYSSPPPLSRPQSQRQPKQNIIDIGSSSPLTSPQRYSQYTSSQTQLGPLSSSQPPQLTTSFSFLPCSQPILTQTTLQFSPSANSSSLQPSNKKREKDKPKEEMFYKLRESLPGSFEIVGRSKLVRGKSLAWPVDEVEIVDLTNI